MNTGSRPVHYRRFRPRLRTRSAIALALSTFGALVACSSGGDLTAPTSTTTASAAVAEYIYMHRVLSSSISANLTNSGAWPCTGTTRALSINGGRYLP
ncbi:MAG: hypothetical protein IH605_17250 [Burkholderiales bacterium]|nr:hypothetical protein [Burkholderiales bacterium]